MNGILIIKPTKKQIAKDVVKLNIVVSGAVLEIVNGLKSGKTPFLLSGSTLDIASNSLSFKPGKEEAYRIILEQFGPQTSPIKVSVHGLDAKGKAIKGESQSITYK